MGITLMSKKKDDDQFSDEEAKRRLVAALQGARLAGHVPMKAKKTGERTRPNKKPGKRGRTPIVRATMNLTQR